MITETKKNQTNAASKNIFKVVISVIEYFLILAIVCECQSMFTCKGEINNATDMTDFFYRLVIVLLFFVIIGHYILYKEKYRNLNHDLIIVLAVEAYSILFYALNVSKIEYNWLKPGYVRNFLVILPMFCLLFRMKRHEGKPFDIFYKHSDIVLVISLLGTIVYFSAVVNNGMIPSDVIYTRWSSLVQMEMRYNFYNLVILRNGGGWTLGGIPLLRNYGFFAEPLMYSIPLIVALFTEMFLRSENDKYRLCKCILFCLVILTTTSTLALMIAAVVWGLLFARFCIKKKKIIFLLPIIIAVIFAVGFFIFEKQAGNYANVGNGSIKQHAEDFRLGWEAFKSKPILGCGYLNDDYVRTFMSEERITRDTGFSNTVALVLAEGGIVFGVLWMLPFAILLLFFKKNGSRNLALWVLGPLALFIGTIWHYRIFMIMIFAFGYSFVEINDNHKLSLACVNVQNIAERKKILKKAPSFITLLMCMIITVLGVFAPPAFWSCVQHALRSNEWDITLSAIKAFYLMTIVLISVVIIWNSVVEEELGKECSFAVILADVTYIFLYKCFYSLVNTMLWLKSAWYEENESFILFVLWIITFGVFYFLIKKIPVLMSLKDICRFVLKLIVVVAILTLAIRFSFSSAIKNLSGSIDSIRILTDASMGRVFVNDFPALHHIANKEVSYSGTKGIGYSMYKDSSIVYWMGTNLKEMFDAGFMVTALSDEYVVYSNDEVAIQNLANQGYQWYRYYPYDQIVNLGELAWRNGLVTTENGSLLVEGQDKSLIYGPYNFIEKGQFKVRYSLHIDRALYGEVNSDANIANVRVSSFSGKKNISERMISLADFDEEGNMEVSIPFSISSFTEGMEYLLFAKEWYPLEIKSIIVNEKPDYITVTTRNGYYYPISEAYFNIDGTAYVDKYGVSRYDKDYDLRGLVKAQRFYDGEGNRVLNSSGISGISYEYNRQSGEISETYYDENDNLSANSSGYAILRYTYDGYGNRIETSCFDADDELVNNVSGYAISRRNFDDKRRVIREEYYDTDNIPVCLSGGQAAFERKYDETGNVIEESYFGQNGEPILYGGSYFKIAKSYNENRKVIREEYFGTSDERLALSGGQASREYEYDEIGNIIEERFFGVDNKPILYNGRYYKIVYNYDLSNRNVLEKYYGIDDEPIALSTGQASVEYAYDEAGNRNEYRYYDASGNPVLYNGAYWKLEVTYNELKQNIREMYYGTDGNIIQLSDGACGYAREYDESGNVIVTKYLGADGNPILNTSGYAIIHRTYDDKKQIVREEYHDESDNLIALNRGQASVEYAYDEAGNRNEYRYYDVSGNPVLYNGAYWKLEVTYNELKQNIREMYCGTDGNIIQLSDGAYGYAREYDEAGNVSKITYLGADGNPVMNTSGDAIVRRDYNDSKQLITEAYYDTSGNPVLYSEAYWMIRFTYNEENKVCKKTYYNLDNEVVNEEIVE